MPHKKGALSTRKRASKEEPAIQKPSKTLKARIIGLIGLAAYDKLERAGVVKELADDTRPDA